MSYQWCSISGFIEVGHSPPVPDPGCIFINCFDAILNWFTNLREIFLFQNRFYMFTPTDKNCLLKWHPPWLGGHIRSPMFGSCDQLQSTSSCDKDFIQFYVIWQILTLSFDETEQQMQWYFESKFPAFPFKVTSSCLSLATLFFNHSAQIFVSNACVGWKKLQHWEGKFKPEPMSTIFFLFLPLPIIFSAKLVKWSNP